MADDPGFLIEGHFYPTPSAFRLGDSVLIADLTGMTFPEFAEALGDEDRRGDPSIFIGLVGVAVWQKHTKWSRSKVAAYVQSLDVTALEFQGGEEEGGDDPPVEAEPGENSLSSDTISNDSPDTTAEPSSQTSLGPHGSDTGSQESPLAA